MRKWNKASVWAVAFSLVMVFSLGGLMGYIAVTPDFVEPTEPVVEADPQDPVWEASFDDLIAYLEERGFVESENYDLISEGVATTARWYNGIELYWWDVENLVEGTDVHTNWTSMQTDGYMLLYGAYLRSTDERTLCHVCFGGRFSWRCERFAQGV